MPCDTTPLLDSLRSYAVLSCICCGDEVFKTRRHLQQCPRDSLGVTEGGDNGGVSGVGHEGGEKGPGRSGRNFSAAQPCTITSPGTVPCYTPTTPRPLLYPASPVPLSSRPLYTLYRPTSPTLPHYCSSPYPPPPPSALLWLFSIFLVGRGLLLFHSLPTASDLLMPPSSPPPLLPIPPVHCKGTKGGGFLIQPLPLLPFPSVHHPLPPCPPKMHQQILLTSLLVLFCTISVSRANGRLTIKKCNELLAVY